MIRKLRYFGDYGDLANDIHNLGFKGGLVVIDFFVLAGRLS